MPWYNQVGGSSKLGGYSGRGCKAPDGGYASYRGSGPASTGAARVANAGRTPRNDCFDGKPRPREMAERKLERTFCDRESHADAIGENFSRAKSLLETNHEGWDDYNGPKRMDEAKGKLRGMRNGSRTAIARLSQTKESLTDKNLQSTVRGFSQLLVSLPKNLPRALADAQKELAPVAKELGVNTENIVQGMNDLSMIAEELHQPNVVPALLAVLHHYKGPDFATRVSEELSHSIRYSDTVLGSIFPDTPAPESWSTEPKKDAPSEYSAQKALGFELGVKLADDAKGIPLDQALDTLQNTLDAIFSKVAEPVVVSRYDR